MRISPSKKVAIEASSQFWLNHFGSYQESVAGLEAIDAE
jgi:hypothetical protein